MAKATASKNVLQFLGDKPAYELTGEEIAFETTVEQRGAEFVARFHLLAKITPHDAKRALRESTPVFKTSSRDRARELDIADDEFCRELVLNNFLRITGIKGDPDPEFQKQWLAAHPLIVSRIWRDGFDSFYAPESEEDGELTLSLDFDDVNVEYSRWLYSEEFGDTNVPFIHRFEPITQGDRIKFRKAMKVIEKNRSQQFRVDHDALEAMYNSKVLSVDGFTLNGEPCTKENRPAWLKLIPFCDKINAINTLMQTGQVKN